MFKAIVKFICLLILIIIIAIVPELIGGDLSGFLKENLGDYYFYIVGGFGFLSLCIYTYINDKDKFVSSKQRNEKAELEKDEINRAASTMQNDSAYGFIKLYEFTKQAEFQQNRILAKSLLKEISIIFMRKFRYVASIEQWKKQAKMPPRDYIRKWKDGFVSSKIDPRTKLSNYMSFFPKFNADTGNEFKLYEIDEMIDWCEEWLSEN